MLHFISASQDDLKRHKIKPQKAVKWERNKNYHQSAPFLHLIIESALH